MDTIAAFAKTKTSSVNITNFTIAGTSKVSTDGGGEREREREGERKRREREK